MAVVVNIFSIKNKKDEKSSWKWLFLLLVKAYKVRFRLSWMNEHSVFIFFCNTTSAVCHRKQIGGKQQLRDSPFLLFEKKTRVPPTFSCDIS